MLISGSETELERLKFAAELVYANMSCISQSRFRVVKYAKKDSPIRNQHCEGLQE